MAFAYTFNRGWICQGKAYYIEPENPGMNRREGNVPTTMQIFLTLKEKKKLQTFEPGVKDQEKLENSISP